ncbi:MAG: RNA methyltransferase [bacterium]
MKEITSINNPLIKKVHSLKEKKNRNEQGLFLLEGYKAIIEALKSGIKLEDIFIDKDFNRKIPDFPNIYSVNEQILRKISTTESPPEILATAYQLKFSINDFFTSDNPVIIILENIKDPGNLGTIIRTAKACNVSGIILTDETVDIYNPKIVRSSAANLWKIPIIYISEKNKIKENLNKFKKSQFIATTVKKAQNTYLYYDIDYKKPTVLMFGSEAEGLSEELLNQADKLITIPMNEQVESLNLSISAGIILYESVRQRLH